MTLVAAIAVLALGALALAVLWRRIPPAPGRLPARIGPAAPRRRPPVDLMRITDMVTGGLGSAGEVHRQIRPLLREVAAGRLAAHEIALDRDGEAARALLGDDLWELVRPDRPRPVDPRGPGLERAQLSAFAERLEAV